MKESKGSLPFQGYKKGGDGEGKMGGGREGVGEGGGGGGVFFSHRKKPTGLLI